MWRLTLLASRWEFQSILVRVGLDQALFVPRRASVRIPRVSAVVTLDGEGGKMTRLMSTLRMIIAGPGAGKNPVRVCAHARPCRRRIQTAPDPRNEHSPIRPAARCRENVGASGVKEACGLC